MAAKKNAVGKGTYLSGSVQRDESGHQWFMKEWSRRSRIPPSREVYSNEATQAVAYPTLPKNLSAPAQSSPPVSSEPQEDKVEANPSVSRDAEDLLAPEFLIHRGRLAFQGRVEQTTLGDEAIGAGHPCMDLAVGAGGAFRATNP